MSVIILSLLVSTLCFAVATDSTTQRIPNTLVLFGLVAGLVAQIFVGAGVLFWLKGVAVAFACFIPLYILRGMAAGDVKLMMVVGGFLGYPMIFTAALNVLMAGGLLALLMVLYKRKLAQLLTNLRSMAYTVVIKKTSGVSTLDGPLENSAGRMPFAPSIALGTFYTLWQSNGLPF